MFLTPSIARFWVQPTGNGDDRKKLDAIETTLGVNAKIPTKVLNADDYISVKLKDSKLYLDFAM